MVKMKVGGQITDFVLDTGAGHSMVTQEVAPLAHQEATVVGATGTHTCRPFCGPCQCKPGGHQVVHEFLYLPDCPVPLLGRDLLARMGMEMTFNQEGSTNCALVTETSL